MNEGASERIVVKKPLEIGKMLSYYIVRILTFLCYGVFSFFLPFSYFLYETINLTKLIFAMDIRMTAQSNNLISLAVNSIVNC